MSATLRAVATAAGVHPSTASRALNPATRHLVASAAAARVDAAAAALRYRPDAAAAGLRTGRSRLVGALVPGIANPVFAPVLAGAAAALAAAGYALLVADPGDDPARAADMIAELASRRVDGLLLATATRADDPALAAAAARGLPVVLVNRAADAPGLAAVISDDAAGMRLAVEHLAALGHRRIGHLAGPSGLSTGHLRRAGFVAAMRAQGLNASAIVEATGYARDAGAVATRALLAAHPDITAIAAANDLLALGAYDACRAAGRAIPRELSITGHNDMPLVDMVDPPLTTVRIAHAEMGARAAAALVAALAGQGATERVLLAPTLVVRGSTAAVTTSAASARPTAPAAAPSPG